MDLSKVSVEILQLEKLLEYFSAIKLVTKNDFAFDKNVKEILESLLSKVNQQIMPVLPEDEEDVSGSKEDKETLSLRASIANLRYATKTFLTTNSKSD